MIDRRLMVNKPKILGTTWETAVVTFLRQYSFAKKAERRALSGGLDKGDIINAVHVFECKNTKSIDLAAGLREAEIERVNASTEYAFLIVKRRQKSTGDAYAVMPFRQLCEILERLHDYHGE